MIRVIRFDYIGHEVAAVVEVGREVRGAFVAPTLFQRAMKRAEECLSGGAQLLKFAFEDACLDGAVLFSFSQEEGLKISGTAYIKNDLIDMLRGYRPLGVSWSEHRALEQVADELTDEILSITELILSQI